jgi:hypothetical protein
MGSEGLERSAAAIRELIAAPPAVEKVGKRFEVSHKPKSFVQTSLYSCEFHPLQGFNLRRCRVFQHAAGFA